MNLLTKDNLGILLGAIGAFGAFKGGYLNFWYWNNNRKLNGIRQERALFVTLKNSDRDLSLFLFKSIFIIFTLIGALIPFQAIGLTPNGNEMVGLGDWILGTSIYMFSAKRLGQMNKLKKFDRTIQRIDAEISKLESKLNKK